MAILSSTRMTMLVFGLSTLWAEKARSETVVGNGGEIPADQNDPWFLGAEQIPYCLELGENQPDIANVRTVLGRALKAWTSFFKTYGFDGLKIGGATSVSPGSFSFADGLARGISSKFSEIPHCDQPEQQLRILIGKPDPMVQQYLSGAHGLPYGLAVRGDYNNSSFRTGGIVWLDGWSLTSSGGIMIAEHELGHVLGFRHNSFAVMDETFYERLAPLSACSYVAQGDDPPMEIGGWAYQMQQGNVLNLTESADDGVKLGGPCGFLSARPLPLALRNTLQLTPSDGYSAHLQVLQTEGPLKLSLLVKSRSGVESRFSGTFTPYSAKLLANGASPAVCTWWSLSGQDAQPFGCLPLDTRPSTLPATGSFSLAGKSYPAVIENNRGLSVKLFVAEAGYWWTLNGAQASVQSPGLVPSQQKSVELTRTAL